MQIDFKRPFLFSIFSVKYESSKKQIQTNDILAKSAGHASQQEILFIMTPGLIFKSSHQNKIRKSKNGYVITLD